jgi:hypothetical protein
MHMGSIEKGIKNQSHNRDLGSEVGYAGGRY